MGRFPYDDDDDIRLDDGAYDDDDDEDLDDDPRVPVLDDVVVPGPGPAEHDEALDPEQAERLHALIREAVDLALDDALDLLRTELHARLREHLDERLPRLVAEALRRRDED
ncbi:MAG: hypothetical protein R3298_06025 [Gammaproteobacteria bacterium]|nr:hypothetical protein [Gammaproteobacteria bacterium]